MEQIDLTGVYPGGEGAILQVQRFEGGKWADFPVPISVSDETFATYVQTSQPGVNRFRVIDTDNGATSNEVRRHDRLTSACGGRQAAYVGIVGPVAHPPGAEQGQPSDHDARRRQRRDRGQR